MSVHQPATSAPSVQAPVHTFRQDVQGLRAVAVVSVMLSHAHVPGFAGGFIGVDVFFVVSGFLITGLLLKDVEAGRVSFVTFYTRRALRILPAATLVICATLSASMVILNPIRARRGLDDGLWSSVFAANIRFGTDGTDYFSQSDVSPLQHFWSLAVEEQFYLVWPAVLALTVFGLRGVLRRHVVHPRHSATTPASGRHVGSHRRLRRSQVSVAHRRVLVALSILGVASLLWSWHETATEPAAAYFSTFARAYELILGALLAVCVTRLESVPPKARAAMTWIGLGGILVAVVGFSDSTPIPGTAALLPTLATCALLAGGVGDPRWGANRLLARQPLRYLGDISYSLYLWHWPLLILGAAYAGHDLRIRVNLLLLLAATVLASVSYHLVENPVRRSRPLRRGRRARPLLLWPVAVALVGMTALIGHTALPSQAVVGHGEVSGAAPPGAAEVKASVLAARAGAPIPSNLQPTIANIPSEETKIGNCSGYRQVSNDICQFGDPTSDRKMVLFGNSHAVAWIPGLSQEAKARKWQMLPVVKEACDFGEYQGSDRNPQCGVWYKWALGQIAKIHPDLIVVNAYTLGPDWQSALTHVITDLQARGTRVTVLADAPGILKKPIDCLQTSGAKLATCMFPESATILSQLATERQLTLAAKADWLDVTPWFCWDSSCPTVVSNRVVYVDIGHMSKTYSEHIAPLLTGPLRL